MRGRGYSRSPPPRGRGYSRSRSPPPYYGRRPRGYSRSPPPPPRGYSRSPPPPSHRGYSPGPPSAARRAPIDRKPAALVTPVINRTINRIYVGNIPQSVSEQTVRAVFSRFGYVKELSMTRDVDLNTHKGWCFIEFDAPESAMGSIVYMNGFELEGRPLKVNHTNAFNEHIWRHFSAKLPNRIYFANVHPLLTEEDMRELFEPFGTLENFSLCPDILTFRHKGYGFAEYATESQANAAVRYLNRLAYENTPDEMLYVTATLVGGPFPEGMGALSRFPRPRASLPPLPAGPKPVLPKVIPEPASAVLLMRNMVGPDDVDEYLKEDVLEECGKYGKIKDVVIHVNSAMVVGSDGKESGVRVFVLYESVAEREAAEKVMNGRFFGGRLVAAGEYSLSKFENGEYEA
ncbi:hypothetical protein BCR44DRAFT_117910 [Catenaria anguillulae PL171]|uniref:RRM domain-containing protein n=1 Tax=Catenaria anguillulae PL171 TaxID=765915 RepID=A0A1Y2HWS5_9FUNG|nr:hypothetical protein BCR44DRAFT_117910 [Catenaria anguillulae PL171]